jgi:hypothetical protein
MQIGSPGYADISRSAPQRRMQTNPGVGRRGGRTPSAPYRHRASLLGLREKESLAGRILHEKGEVLEQLREHSGTISPRESGSPARFRTASPIKIHDFEWNGPTIRERVHLLRQSNWYWERKNWKPRDLAVREDGRLSFDVKLARNPKKIDLRRNGWKSDHCFVCEWTLFESEEQPDRGTGYTNGRDWVCAECYEKFLSGPDYFRSAPSGMT